MWGKGVSLANFVFQTFIAKGKSILLGNEVCLWLCGASQIFMGLMVVYRCNLTVTVSAQVKRTHGFPLGFAYCLFLLTWNQTCNISVSLNGLKPSLKVSLCSKVNLLNASPVHHTESIPAVWMGAVWAVFWLRTWNALPITQFHSFLIYLKYVMLCFGELTSTFLAAEGTAEGCAPRLPGVCSLQMICVSWKEVFVPLGCRASHNTSARSTDGPHLPRWRCVTTAVLERIHEKLFYQIRFQSKS